LRERILLLFHHRCDRKFAHDQLLWRVEAVFVRAAFVLSVSFDLQMKIQAAGYFNPQGTELWNCCVRDIL